MAALFPILAAIFQAISVTLDKIVLSFRRVSFRTYLGVSFPLIFLITLVIFLIVEPPLTRELFAGGAPWFILGSSALTIFSNLIFYRALDHDRLSELETLTLLDAVPIILFSSIIFADERKLFVIAPALIATFAVIWSHWEGHHFKLRTDTAPYLIWIFFAAPLGAYFSKVLLQTWHPISLELVRSGIVALALRRLIPKHIRAISPKVILFLILTNLFTTVAWILYYFSYQRSGIIYTILLFSLQPLLVYLASIFVIHERIQYKKIIAFSVVLVSITVAQLFS